MDKRERSDEHYTYKIGTVLKGSYGMAKFEKLFMVDPIENKDIFFKINFNLQVTVNSDILGSDFFNQFIAEKNQSELKESVDEKEKYDFSIDRDHGYPSHFVFHMLQGKYISTEDNKRQFPFSYVNIAANKKHMNNDNPKHLPKFGNIKFVFEENPRVSKFNNKIIINFHVVKKGYFSRKVMIRNFREGLDYINLNLNDLISLTKENSMLIKDENGNSLWHINQKQNKNKIQIKTQVNIDDKNFSSLNLSEKAVYSDKRDENSDQIKDNPENSSEDVKNKNPSHQKDNPSYTSREQKKKPVTRFSLTGGAAGKGEQNKELLTQFTSAFQNTLPKGSAGNHIRQEKKPLTKFSLTGNQAVSVNKKKKSPAKFTFFESPGNWKNRGDRGDSLSVNHVLSNLC